MLPWIIGVVAIGIGKVIYDEVNSSSSSSTKSIETSTKDNKIEEVNKDIEKFKIDSENLVKNKYGSVDIHFNQPTGHSLFNSIQQAIPNESKQLISITDFKRKKQEKGIAILEEDIKNINKLINIFQKEKENAICRSI